MSESERSNKSHHAYCMRRIYRGVFIYKNEFGYNEVIRKNKNEHKIDYTKRTHSG